MGKYSKKARACPALAGQPLKPAECGARRGSELDCPAECVFYPLGTANYEALIKVENDWMEAAIDWLTQRWGEATFKERLAEAVLPMQDQLLAWDYAVHNVVHYGLNFRPDAEGRTEAERWEREGWPGLNNDGRVFARHARGARPAVLEVRRVLDESRCRCVDLLQPEQPPFIVLDQSLARAVVPFTGLLVWLVALPHYHRALGVAMEVEPDLWPPLRERIEARFAEVREQRPNLDFTTFLAEEMRWVGLEADQLQKAKRRTGLPHIFQTYFTPRASVDELVRRLEAAPDFRRTEPNEEFDEEGAHSFDWRPTEGPGAGATGADEEADEPSWQMVRVHEEEVEISCVRPEIRQALRQRVEQVLGEGIAFREEQDMDLAKAVMDRLEQEQLVEIAQQDVFGEERPFEPVDEPESDPASMAVAIHEQYLNSLDQPDHRWGGKTMREAARDETLRPQVIETVKVWIHHVGRLSQRTGQSLSLDSLIDELGLDELK